MTVLRWILSYLGVILVLIGVVLGYVYREELMAWFDASDRQVAQTESDSGSEPGGSLGAQPAAPEAPAPAPQGRFAPPGYVPPGPPPVAVAPETSPDRAAAPAYAPAPTRADAPATPARSSAPGVPSGSAPAEATDSTKAAPASTPPPSAAEPRPSAAPPSEATAEAQSSSPAYPARPPDYGPRPYPPVYAESHSSARTGVVPPRYTPPVRPRPYPAPPEVQPPAPLSDDQRSALTEARDAFWKQGPEAATELYQSVAEANPDNPDIQGELANVYFALGKRAEAAEAYARVVKILHEQGRRAEAARVMRTVLMLDRERAEGLMRELAPAAPDARGAEGAEKP